MSWEEDTPIDSIGIGIGEVELIATSDSHTHTLLGWDLLHGEGIDGGDGSSPFGKGVVEEVLLNI